MTDPIALLTGSGSALVALWLWNRHLIKDRDGWKALYLEARARTDKMPDLLSEQAEASRTVLQGQGEQIAELGRVVHAQNRGLEALANLRRSDRPGAYRLIGGDE